MEHNQLSGIERELVLKYLEDGNVPVTVTPVTSLPQKSDLVPTTSSAVFPIAIRASKINVLEQGIIVLKNPQQSVNRFVGQSVRVEFYFNKLGLYFITEMKQIREGLALVIPAHISRITDVSIPEDHRFSATLFYSCANKRDIHIACVPASGYTLFSRPVWSDIQSDRAEIAKKYLIQFILAGKKQQEPFNGVFLISVCRYLSENISGLKAVADRSEPLAVLYVDHECIVFGYETARIPVEQGAEYALKLSFPLKDSPVEKRDVFVTCMVKKIWNTGESERICILCPFTSIKEEDKRFIYETVTKKLFN